MRLNTNTRKVADDAETFGLARGIVNIEDKAGKVGFARFCARVPLR